MECLPIKIARYTPCTTCFYFRKRGQDWSEVLHDSSLIAVDAQPITDAKRGWRPV